MASHDDDGDEDKDGDGDDDDGGGGAANEGQSCRNAVRGERYIHIYKGGVMPCHAVPCHVFPCLVMLPLLSSQHVTKISSKHKYQANTSTMLPCIMITSPLLANASPLALASAVPAAVAHGVRLDKEVRQDKARQGKARPGQARQSKAKQGKQQHQSSRSRSRPSTSTKADTIIISPSARLATRNTKRS